MDDFEFSVDISEQDWKCFFSQCEECNVLSPSLAGLEDSGMSDLDEAGARFAMKLQKSNFNTDLLEEDEPADSPWECPPDELYPSKHFSGGLESVLSGSEEDIHLQSVNMFIEQMKSSSEGVKSAKQGQVGVVQNRTMQGKLGGAGRLNKSTGSALPKKISKLNSISDIKTSKPVSPIQNKYFVRTDESSSESSVSVFMRHPYLKTQLYIESSTENENDPLSKINMSEGFSSIKPNPVMNSKYTVDKSTQVSQSNTDTMPKAVSMEGSPCASVKRKRRKKRRLSVEPANNLFSCERLCDSEDELFTWRRAIDPCFCDWSGLKHQHVKNGITPSLRQYTFSNSLPAGLETTKIQPKIQHCQYQSVLIQDNFDSTSVTKIWPSTDCDHVKNIGGFAGMDELSQVKEIQKAKVASQDLFRNEVKSITDSIFPSAESNDQREAIGQSDRGSSAKLVMREEAETKTFLQCQREGAHHQQLETQTLMAYQCSHMVDNMKPTCISSIPTASDKTRCYASQSSDQESEETFTTLPLSVDSTVVIDNNEKKAYISSNHEIIEVCETDAPQETSEGYLVTSGNVAQISELQAISDKQSLSTSYSMLSSGCTPETKPLPKENIYQTSECFALSQNGPTLQNECVQVISMYQTKDLILQNKIHNLTDEAAEPCWDQVEAAITKCESKDLTDPIISDHAVFAMSSFWKEMEKITINDILGLRKERKTPSSFLPSLEKTDNTDCFTLSDLGCCIQTEEKKLDQACKDVQATIPGPVDCNMRSIQSDTSASALRENELVPMSLPQENIHNTKRTLDDIYEPLVSPGIQKGLRRMSNNISVQNLHLLHSNPSGYKCIQPSMVESVDEDRCNEIDSLPEEPMLKGDLKPSSMIENLTFCISDFYSYFFSEKQPDSSLESPIEIAVNHFTKGDSVPENYDHFFSEFDTDTLFYTEEVNSELVPIFSCSRSSKTTKECCDAYDYFLVSSPENSSTESDEEDSEDSAPIRVVTRFTRKASSKDIVTDAYEHFYTDRDLKQDFFKTTFSFRNFNLPGSSAVKPASTSAEALSPLRQKSGLFQKSAPISDLRNQDFVFPDSGFCNFDKRIITKLQQPLIFESIQTAVANPNLDAPLLPLKQSDMCLICIAFASWVLKTANPQVGDAWKAVVLANVSALSAIRYLRKYVKVESSAGEKKPNLKSISPS